jgi:hypothetical protein
MLKLLTGFLGLISGLATAAGPIQFEETLINAQGKEKRVIYTPYFVLDYFVEDLGLLCRTFVTLGDERLSGDNKNNYTKNAKNLFKNGELVYAVAETYFYNWSENPIKVEPTSFTWKGASSETPFEISNYLIEVEPQSQSITPPIIQYAFYLTKEFEITFDLKINGKPHQIKGMAKRMTQEDLMRMNQARQQH